MARTLYQKLGIRPGDQIQVFHSPVPYHELVPETGEEEIMEDGAAAETLDFIHLFCLNEEVLMAEIGRCKAMLKKGGMLWVSWPKGTSSISTDINREDVRKTGLQAGLVDVKVASINDDWSGLKFVYRTQDR